MYSTGIPGRMKAPFFDIPMNRHHRQARYAPRHQYASVLHDVDRTIDTDELARYEFPAITDAIHTTELIPRLQVTGTAYMASDLALLITFSGQVRHTRTADEGVSFRTGLMMSVFLYVEHNSTWSTRL